MEKASEIYLLVRNIPKHIRSKHLRLFFSEFIETSKFICFHFLHRIERKLAIIGPVKTSSLLSADCCCCVIKIHSNNLKDLVRTYHGKPWSLGLPQCLIEPLPKDEKLVYNKLQELHPPPVMPNGNVGTPTSVFINEIRQCKLPSSLISRLGLTFPKASGRKYANVPFNYDEKDEKSESDDDNCEEWERHEALTDDPGNQERLGERMYEEPLEVVWDKGGSGLVFYTDAQYWDELAGDFDEKTADDLDVDMSVYYEGWEAGDMDARQRIEMAESDRHAIGVYKEDRDAKPPNQFRKIKARDRSRSPIAGSSKKFEGYGQHILESCGWKDGQGLGIRNQGISEPIEADGQGPKERKGFGYRGAKLDLKSAVEAARQKALAKRGPRLIATAFDKPSSSKDPGVFRRSDHYELRHNHDEALPSSSAKPQGSIGISGTDFR